MLLYDSSWSGNCYKVRLLLSALGIAFDRHELSVSDRSGRPQLIGALNPALRIPTLVLDDGRPLAESGAILFYFAEGTEYLPADRYERAQVLQWMFFEQYDHEPNLAVLRAWARLGVDRPQAEIDAKHEAGARALAAMERHLTDRTFLVGERFSIADIALFAYTHVAPEGGVSLDPHPAIRAWIARIEALPGHIAITD
jgi:glutathione S-transferase